MKAIIVTLSGIGFGIVSAAGAYAHHSFAAEFDRNQNVEFTGTVTNVEWTNPHARFYVTGADPDMDDDTPVGWNIELASANVLMRQGWRRDSLKVGDVVTVTASRARLDPHVVNARTVVDGNGDRLFARGPGQPDAGDD